MRTLLTSAALAVALSLPGRAAAEGGKPPPARAPLEDEAPLATPNRAKPLDDACAEPPPPRPFATSALGTVTAVIPGLVVHGTGHMVVGDSKTGLRLLALEGVGLGLLATGFVPIVLSGASRRIVGPAAALSVVGAGIFAISFLADVYGIVAPVGGFGAPPRALPILQTAIGYRYVYNPVFAHRHFMVQEIDYRTGPWRIHPSAWFAADDANSRVRLHGAYRFAGPRPEAQPAVRDGSFLDLETAITRHAFTSDRFATTTGELALAGTDSIWRESAPRCADRSPKCPSAGPRKPVRTPSAVPRPTWASSLLARFAFGMYRRLPGSPRGEISVIYDHRHDDFAAGLKVPGLGSGVAGHFRSRSTSFRHRPLGRSGGGCRRLGLRRRIVDSVSPWGPAMKTKPKPKPFRRHPRRLDRARAAAFTMMFGTLLGAPWVACLDVAEERAHRDETIGKGAFGGTTLEVVDGLAAIQKARNRGGLAVGKSSFHRDQGDAQRRRPPDWILTVENAFPDAPFWKQERSLVPWSRNRSRAKSGPKTMEDSRFPAVLRLFRFARPAVNPSPRGASPCSATFKRPSIGCRTSTRA